MTIYELEVAVDYAFTRAADTRIGTPESNEAWKEYATLNEELEKRKKELQKFRDIRVRVS